MTMGLTWRIQPGEGGGNLRRSDGTAAETQSAPSTADSAETAGLPGEPVATAGAWVGFAAGVEGRADLEAGLEAEVVDLAVDAAVDAGGLAERAGLVETGSCRSPPARSWRRAWRHTCLGALPTVRSTPSPQTV